MPEDAGALFWFALKRSHKMQCFVLAFWILSALLYVAVFGILSGQKISGLQWAIAAVIGLISALVVYPALVKRRVKKHKRTFSISPSGITTQIGSKHMEIAWPQIENVWVTEEHIFVVRMKLKVFTIPRRAFRDAAEREAFVRLLRAYWDNSK